jgi:hypothetical protein
MRSIVVELQTDNSLKGSEPGGRAVAGCDGDRTATAPEARRAPICDLPYDTGRGHR